MHYFKRELILKVVSKEVLFTLMSCDTFYSLYISCFFLSVSNVFKYTQMNKCVCLIVFKTNTLWGFEDLIILAGLEVMPIQQWPPKSSGHVAKKSSTVGRS